MHKLAHQNLGLNRDEVQILVSPNNEYLGLDSFRQHGWYLGQPALKAIQLQDRFFNLKDFGPRFWKFSWESQRGVWFLLVWKIWAQLHVVLSRTGLRKSGLLMESNMASHTKLGYACTSSIFVNLINWHIIFYYFLICFSSYIFLVSSTWIKSLFLTVVLVIFFLICLYSLILSDHS